MPAWVGYAQGKWIKFHHVSIYFIYINQRKPTEKTNPTVLKNHRRAKDEKTTRENETVEHSKCQKKTKNKRPNNQTKHIIYLTIPYHIVEQTNMPPTITATSKTICMQLQSLYKTAGWQILNPWKGLCWQLAFRHISLLSKQFPVHWHPQGEKIENTLTICRPLEIKQSIDGVAHDHTYIFLHIYTTHYFLDGLSSFQDTVPFSNTIEVEAAKQGFQDPLQSSQLLQLEFHGFLFKLFKAII